MPRIPLPPLQALRALEAAARLRSYSRAAEELGLTHGAVSHQIRGLEERLGVALFRRVGNAMHPTRAAHPLVAEVRRGLLYLERAWAEAARPRGRRTARASSTVTVSLLPSFAARWLVPRLGKFTTLHPDISVVLRPSAELVDLTEDRTTDLAIRYGPGGWAGLEAVRLMDESLIVVCAPNYRGGRLPRRPKDLARCVLLRHPRQPWADWCEAAGIDLPEPAGGPSYDDASLLLQAAAAGQGVALARASLASDDLAAGRLVRLFNTSVPDQFAWWIVWRGGDRLGEAATAFRDWVIEEAR